MLIIITIGLGLILGSFLSVLLERWPHERGMIAGRSECPHCHHVLAWYDLVPLVSWIILRGRCRYCRARISVQYVALEVVTALVFGVFAFHLPESSAVSVTMFGILFCLVALLFFDLRWRILPDLLVGALAGGALVRAVLLGRDVLINDLLTGAIIAMIVGALYVVSRGRWLGLGDVKMAVPIGILFGWPGAFLVTLYAVWIGAALGIGLILTKRATMKTALPFGTFWAAVAIGAFLWPGLLHLFPTL